MPRSVLRFLIQFSVSLNKSRSYPPGHPVLASSLEILRLELQSALGRIPVLSIGLTRDYLLIDGAVADAGNPVLRDLAGKLHRHQLAAIQIRPGVEVEELATLLAALGSESWRQGEPLGLKAGSELEAQWPHVKLQPLPLEHLELGARADEGRPSGVVWEALLRAAMLLTQDPPRSGGPEGQATGPPTAEQVAAVIRNRRGDREYDRAVVDWMIQVAEQFDRSRPDGGVQQQLQTLFSTIGPEAMQRLVGLGAPREQCQQLLLAGSRSLPIRAVLELVEAAAPPGGTPSEALLRVLGKLADHADPSLGPTVVGAEVVLRDSIRQLAGTWDSHDGNDAPHRRLLELLAKPGSHATEPGSGRRSLEAMRMLQMGVELGAGANRLANPLRELHQQVPVSALMAMITTAESAGLDPAPLWEAMTGADHLVPRLVEEDADLAVLDEVLRRLGPSAVAPLLDALEAATGASRRRWLLTCLASHQEGLGAELVARLPGKPWYVVRNLLGLLASQPSLPAGFSPEPYTRHEDGRVRREAYKLMFAMPGASGTAVLSALADADLGIVRMAMMTGQSAPSAELQRQLLDLLRDRLREPEDRVAAIRLLGNRPSPTVRDWLVQQVRSSRRLFWIRRLRLSPKSPEMLAALSLLAAHYSSDSRVSEVLAKARRSRDPQIAAAARPGIAS